MQLLCCGRAFQRIEQSFVEAIRWLYLGGMSKIRKFHQLSMRNFGGGLLPENGIVAKGGADIRRG
jgi:hypothetical protein